MPRIAVQYRTTSREVYARFCLKHPDMHLTYAEWCNIIYTFNYAFRDYALETGHKARFPFGFGDFCVTKFKPKKFRLNNKGEQVIGLPIDWKKTKEAGRRIYHMNYSTEGFKFRWLWDASTARFAKSDVWSFKPSRISSRLINHYIKQGYQDKYLEWKK